MKWKYWLPTLGLAAIFLVLIWNFPAEELETSCSDIVPAPTVIAFGDSLIEGQGATTPGGFVTLLSRQSGVSIQNFGRGGDTTETAKKRVAEALAARPAIVLILLGGNDALRRVSQETTQRNLDEILAAFRQAGAEVILLGAPGGIPFKDPYPQMYEALADKHDAVYVSNVLAGLIGKAEYMDDAVHPNEKGYASIAERVSIALRKACGRL